MLLEQGFEATVLLPWHFCGVPKIQQSGSRALLQSYFSPVLVILQS